MCCGLVGRKVILHQALLSLSRVWLMFTKFTSVFLKPNIICFGCSKESFRWKVSFKESQHGLWFSKTEKCFFPTHSYREVWLMITQLNYKFYKPYKEMLRMLKKIPFREMGLLVKGKVVLHQSLLPGGLVGVYSIVLSFSKPHVIWFGDSRVVLMRLAF